MSKLSVTTLAYQRNPAYYGRKDLLQEVDDHLHDREGDLLIRPIALLGTGGSGKSEKRSAALVGGYKPNSVDSK